MELCQSDNLTFMLMRRNIYLVMGMLICFYNYTYVYCTEFDLVSICTALYFIDNCLRGLFFFFQ